MILTSILFVVALILTYAVGKTNGYKLGFKTGLNAAATFIEVELTKALEKRNEQNNDKLA